MARSASASSGTGAVEARTLPTTSARISRRVSSPLADGMATDLSPVASFGISPLRMSAIRSDSRTSPSLMAV